MTSAGARQRRPSRTLLIVLLVVTLWGATPPWTGPPLDLGIENVPYAIEILTHAVPSAILVMIAVAGLGRRLPLPAALLAVLIGLWMTATHAPLVVQGLGGRVPMDAALFHSLPGFTILGLTIAVAVGAWRNEVRAAPRQTTGRRPTQ